MRPAHAEVERSTSDAAGNDMRAEHGVARYGAAAPPVNATLAKKM
jgi:hypothetical protein